MSPRGQTTVSIRSFRPEDQAACKHLYVEAALTESLAPNDTGYDVDDIAGVYMASPENHFWVAESRDHQIVGCLGVQHHDKGVAEIRRLRVLRNFRRRGIGSMLLETALRFCQLKGDVKITLDTVMDRAAALSLFEKFHFKLLKSRKVGEKEVLYFYLDLYAGQKKKAKETS
jgi:ribosomal protein S18 acetylase RimI-like enzyme